MKKLKTKVLTCVANQDLIEYPKGHTIVVGYEFNVYNVGDIDIEIKLNESEDALILEPGEGFNTQFPIQHAIVLTDGAKVKYSYWV